MNLKLFNIVYVLYLFRKELLYNMESVLKIIQKTQKEPEDKNLIKYRLLKDEIKEICRQLELTEKWFQYEKDDNLIEACIYQREVLNAKYRYLMQKLKCFDFYDDHILKEKCL